MLRIQKNIRVDRKKSNICRIPIVSYSAYFCVEEKFKIVIVILTFQCLFTKRLSLQNNQIKKMYYKRTVNKVHAKHDSVSVIAYITFPLWH